MGRYGRAGVVNASRGVKGGENRYDLCEEVESKGLWGGFGFWQEMSVSR